MKASRVRQAVIEAGRLQISLVIDAAASLVARPVHTIAMVTGVMLGVMGATAAFVIADTQQAQIDHRFDLQRSEEVVLKAGTPLESGFPAAQVDSVRRLEPVTSVGEFSIWSNAEEVSRSFSSTESAYAPLIVTDPGGMQATGTTVTSGASSALLGIPTDARLAWVGQSLAHELGLGPAGGNRLVEAQVVVRGTPFSIAGIVQNHGGFGYASGAILISRTSAVDLFGGAGDNVRLVAHVRPGSAGAVASYALRSIDTDGSLALSDVTAPDGTILVTTVAADLRRIGTALGLIMGIVGMITVANTLTMSVHQRTRELGLRSAMGWRRRRIGALILIESALAGSVAGVLGSAVGSAVATAWCWLHGWNPTMPSLLPVVLVAFGVGASLVGGVAPALRAASISPLVAMRS